MNKSHIDLNRHSQLEAGAVLILALFIVALVATLAYVMIMRLERDIHRSTLVQRNTQAEFYAQASVAWAKDQLRNDWERQKTNRIIDAIPIESPENEVNGYKIKSVIMDMQSRFNINNLIEGEYQNDFKHLLEILAPDLSQENKIELVKAISEWISPLSAKSKNDTYYSDLKNPYREGHRLMLSVSELRLVKGMTNKLFNTLEPYLSALPITTSINVQTAEIPVLVSLSSTMTLTKAEEISILGKRTPILSTEALMNLAIMKDETDLGKKITVSSQYFLVKTTVRIENQQLVLYTLLERLPSEGKGVVHILWQSKGVW